MTPKIGAMRRLHQIEKLLWALINNAYPAVRARGRQTPPLSRVKQVITRDQQTYDLHRQLNAPYTEFILDLWEEIDKDPIGMNELLRRYWRIDRTLKLHIGIGVNVPELQFEADDLRFLHSLEISPD